MRPSRIIALVDAGTVAIATMVFIRPGPLGIAYGATTLIVMWASGAYRPRIFYRLSTQLPSLLAQLMVSTLVVAALVNRHRLPLLEYLPITAGTVILGRLVVYRIWRSARARSGVQESALIIGASERGCLVAGALLGNRGCGIAPVGFVDHNEALDDSPLPIVGDLNQLDDTVERMGIKHLIVADPGETEGAVCTRLWHCQARDIDVWTVPTLFERGADPCGLATDDLWAIPFQHCRRPGQYTGARLVKRAFDFSVAALMLILTAPLLAIVALVVRCTSPGPVFFRQKRIGQNGREFSLLKFRTMRVNSDSDTMWSVTDEQRMTPIGQLLRRTSIDELPQVFNVLRGDMSLVGPRPERPHFHENFSATIDHYSDRLRAPVGITGWAQIHGLRGDTSIADRTRFDNFYIEHWSLWFDVVIMVRTISAIVQWVFVPDAPCAGAKPRIDPVVRIPANVGGNQS